VEWVRDADVRRRFPDALEIRIEEHQPFARWQVGGADGDADRGLLVNSFGEVFEADTDAVLPVLSGPPNTSREVMTQWIAFGQQLDTPAGSAANLRLAELHLSARRAWRVRLASGSTLELGRNDPAERLGRFVRAYPGVAALQLANARIDLRYQNGLAVRVARVATAPAAVPAAATKTKQATTKQAITKKAAKK
jgi:cell division protein FtsQ